MNIVLMGTNDWVIPGFNRIADEHNVVAVFTRAPKPAGRKMHLTKSPVHEWADARGLTVHTNINDFDKLRLSSPPVEGWPQAGVGFDNLKSGQAHPPASPYPSTGGELANPKKIDMIVVMSYGVILRDNVLSSAPVINIHPSLLPKYRGPSPMLTAIYNGDTKTGICLMDVTETVDAGDVHMTREIEIGENETNAELENRVAKISADMLSEYLKNPDAYPGNPQVGDATFTRKFTSTDMNIDWNKTPIQIHNQVRSIGGRTKINGIDVKILQTRVVKGVLEIIQIQPAGKNPMDWKSFVNGQRGGEIKFGE